MTASEFALVLFVIGALLAVAGPAIAAVRTAATYKRSKQVKGTAAELNKLVEPSKVQAEARANAWWGVAEFAFVGLGVALTAVASIIVLP